MRANVSVTTELLGAFGVPAVPHGNVIEIATGMVGVDDACSGIRSFQATLMISLFFGELYALTAMRRVLCVFAGFGLSFVFNVARTTLLTWVAAHKGTAAIASWHDPAGVTILVACFLCLWLIARGLRGKAETLKAENTGGKAETLKAEMLKSEGRGTEDGGGKAETLKAENTGGKAETLKAEMLKSETLRSPGPFSFSAFQRFSFSFMTGSPMLFSVSAFQRFSILLAAWLLTVEAGTELWYRSHEWRVPMATAWHVEFPRDNATFRELPLSDKTRQFLRYDAGENGTWQEGADQRWQAIFFRWNPGRIAVHLAKSHTPEVCLTAAGRELLSQAGIRAIPVHGLQLPFRSYVVKDERGPLRVFYCLWEDRANAQSFRTSMMTYGNRLAPVLAGRRNSGQRSLEVAIWGIADEGEAEAALGRELDKLIKLEKPQRDQETTDHRPRTTDHGPLLVSDFSFSAFQLFSIFF
jgi:exosortase/archaeosortase family protein